jgi:predicted Zn finger-like uncharacterized protein
MTLATRCPACGTAFRVVQDQLRVSQGWVRCGRCSEAFNAVESMVDVPTVLTPDTGMGSDPPHTDFSPTAVMDWPDGTAPGSGTAQAAPAVTSQQEPAVPAASASPWPPSGSEPAYRVAELHDDEAAYVLDDSQAAPQPVTAAESSDSLLDLPIGLHLIASDGAMTSVAEQPVLAVANVDSPLEVAASQTDDVLDPGFASKPGTVGAEPFLVLAQATTAPATAWTAAPAEDSAEASEQAGLAPSFVVKADRAARWQRPGVRAMLGLVALVGLAGLAAQVTHAFRDRLAAALPAARPLLVRACESIGCTIEDFRQIDALSVESSGLVRVEGSPVYRLSVTLRNRAGVEVAAPALDLSLTDAGGNQMARRVLLMRDLYLPLRTLKAGSELPIQVPLNIGDRPVSGYTVEIFYP